LSDQNGEHYGSLGSYCWNGICVDYAPPFKRTDLNYELIIKRGTSVNFDVRGYIKPNKYRISIFSGDTIISETNVEKEIKLEIPEGKYVLGVKADWTRKGDISYVFPIVIK
jgi:hypothetical protein